MYVKYVKERNIDLLLREHKSGCQNISLNVFINGPTLSAILNPDDWSAERQLSELRRYLKRLR